jgi:hypothetical protein
MEQTALVILLVAGLGLAGCSNVSSEAPPVTATATATPTQTATARPTASATPTPKPIATSGSYAADVTKLGIKPDNMQSYASWMKERICDQDRIGLGIAVRSVGGGTPADGGGIDVVRLTNAYFCPTKTQEIEAALEYFRK